VAKKIKTAKRGFGFKLAVISVVFTKQKTAKPT
jgi:hypothetical protein